MYASNGAATPVRTIFWIGRATAVGEQVSQGEVARDGDTRDITDMLLAWAEGDDDALERLVPTVYAELRRLAARAMGREGAGHTLQPTAVIHEAYVQLIDQRRVRWQSRAHFFGVAATLMRRVLLRHAERKRAGKRGGGMPTLRLGAGLDLPMHRADTLVALDDALRGLAAFDQRQSRIVELRFFGGLSVDEAAHVLGLAPITVKREWRIAKAWLKRELVGARRSA